MAVHFIFEDKETTPSSILLKNCFNGRNIHFSGGVQNLKLELIKWYNTEDMYLLFIDLVPNNQETVVYYENLLQDIYSSYSNVYVIPIICIEFYLSLFLKKYGYSRVGKNGEILENNLVGCFNWNILPKDKRLISLEHLYKNIISEQILICMRNENRVKNTSYGKFYKADCPCDYKYCSKCSDSLLLKAERFYSTLPVFDIISSEHEDVLKKYNIYSRNVKLEEVMVSLQNLYNDICREMGVKSLRIS